jgi:hypothetical protein
VGTDRLRAGYVGIPLWNRTVGLRRAEWAGGAKDPEDVRQGVQTAPQENDKFLEQVI